MRLIKFMLLAMSLPTMGSVATAANITSLDIYPYSAKATFVVSASAEMVVELPASFDEYSVKPILKEGQELLFFQTSTVKTNKVPEALIKLEKILIDKRNAVQTITNKIGAHRMTLATVSAMISNSEGSSRNLSETFASLLDIQLKSDAQIIELSNDLTKQQRELEALETEYQNILPPMHEYSIIVEMGIGGSIKKGDTVMLEANTSHANWQPKYDMRLDSATGTIKSTLSADVNFNAGVSYEGKINFFTQTPPIRSISVPEPSPWRVGYSEPIQRPSPIMKSGGAMNEFYSADMNTKNYRAKLAVQMIESPISTILSTEGAISGGNTKTTIELLQRTLNSKTEMIIFVDVSENALIMATLQPLNEPMLAGNASMYIDGQYSANTIIEFKGRGEEVSIAFGYTPTIKATKELDVSKSGSGFLSTGTVQDGYKIVLTNGSKAKAKVKLLDRLPISTDDKIVVDSMLIEPEPEKDKNNILTWNFELESGAKETITVKYRIKHPANREISY